MISIQITEEAYEALKTRMPRIEQAQMPKGRNGKMRIWDHMMACAGIAHFSSPFHGSHKNRSPPLSLAMSSLALRAATTVRLKALAMRSANFLGSSPGSAFSAMRTK